MGREIDRSTPYVAPTGTISAASRHWPNSLPSMKLIALDLASRHELCRARCQRRRRSAMRDLAVFRCRCAEILRGCGNIDVEGGFWGVRGGVGGRLCGRSGRCFNLAFTVVVKQCASATKASPTYRFRQRALALCNVHGPLPPRSWACPLHQQPLRREIKLLHRL